MFLSRQRKPDRLKAARVLETLDQIHPRRQHSRKASQNGDPQVGIFWTVNGGLILVGLHLGEAEPYGRFKNYPLSHEQVWHDYQRINTVPVDLEYDDPPRGRVVFDSFTSRFHTYADTCILVNEDIMTQIRSRLRLPADTSSSSD